jgi:hypothetical protein
MLITVILFFHYPAYSQSSNGIPLSVDSISYCGYLITQISEKIDSIHEFIGLEIRKNHSIEFRIKPCADIKWELKTILANGRMQLFVQTYSGGAHGPYSYWIFDFHNRIDILYHSDGKNSELDYITGFFDADSNGSLEFKQYGHLFRCFPLPRSESPAASVILTYSPQLNRFIQANRRFSRFILGDESIRLKEIQESDNSRRLNKDPYYLEQCKAKIIKLLVDYIYSGEESTGWKMFNRWYKFSDKAEVEQCVRENLSESNVYIDIYHK